METTSDTRAVAATARALPADALVVDDSPSDQRLVCESLVELGVDRARIRTASTLRDARSALAAGPAGLILLDLSLPDASGLESVAVLATAAPETPIVVVTGSPAADTLVYAALAEGAEEYLTKSDLGTERFRRAVFRAVERRRGTERTRRAERGTGGVLDSIDAPTAALDGSGQIIETNLAWMAVGAGGRASPASIGVGVNYLAICDLAAGAWSDGAAEAADGIRAVLRGDEDRFSLDYPCPLGEAERWFTLRVTPLGEAGGGAVVTHLDITLLKHAELRLQRRELRLPSAFDQSSSIFALIEPDGQVRHVSDATRALLGLGEDVTVVPGVLDRVDAADLDEAIATFARVVSRPLAKERCELTVVAGDGRRRRLDLLVANMLHDPHVAAIAVSGSDVTGSRRAQITRRLESRLLMGLPAAVVVTDDRGVVVFWNDRSAAIYGCSADEVVGRRLVEVGIGPVRSEDVARIKASIAADGHWEGDCDASRADGSVVPIYATLERVEEEDIGFSGHVGASVDISERRRLERDLAFQAHHDALTGLPNRRMLVEQLDGAVARSRRRGGSTAVLFLDVDDFKAINDSAGHLAGDQVLRAVGRLITGVVRAGDMVARLGGDEFVVCCEDVRDLEEAQDIAGRMLDALRSPIQLGGRLCDVSASIGLALSGATTGGEALLRNADAAMYAAKEGGKGRIECFDDALHERARRRHEMVLELDRAIAGGELVTYYQPEVHLPTGTVFGFEALVRWCHPERGLVPPEEFVGIAEDSGLVNRLGAQVLGDACRALAGWLARVPDHPLTMSVNISARQLADPGLEATLRAVLEETGAPADRLCLEVTESALMDPSAAARALWALRRAGVKVAIDDFGTGYSSLSRLKSLPVDFLKIDRTFIAGLGSDVEDDVIVTAVANLGRSLGLRLIAEGIEDAEQVPLLRSLGCDLGQGFLWSGALPLAEATALVDAGPGHRLPHVQRPPG